MKQTDISVFCANRLDDRAFLWTPFQHGACVYATNGHMMVRVPRDEMPHVVANDMAPKNVEKMFNDALALEGEFTPLPTPDLLPSNRTCNDCNGTGLELSFDEDDPCFTCGGLGILPDPIDIGDASYKLPYVRLMAALPNARIRAHGRKLPAVVLFDGGQGLLMPCIK